MLVGVLCVVAFGLRLHVASGFCAFMEETCIALVTLNKRLLYDAACQIVLLATLLERLRPPCSAHLFLALFASQQPSSSSLDGLDDLDHSHPKPEERSCGRLETGPYLMVRGTGFQSKRHKP